MVEMFACEVCGGAYAVNKSLGMFASKAKPFAQVVAIGEITIC